jgi:hypothetical protein
MVERCRVPEPEPVGEVAVDAARWGNTLEGVLLVCCFGGRVAALN